MGTCSRKIEIKVAIDCCYLDNLKNRLGANDSTHLIRTAMTLLDWASEEISAERVIISTDVYGGQIHRLVMQELSKTTR